MNLYIKNTYGNRPATAYDMAEYLLGSRKAKIPTDGLPAREIQGVTVWVKALVPRPHLVRNFTGLRVLCNCPKCGKTMPVGRLAQHAKIHATKD